MFIMEIAFMMVFFLSMNLEILMILKGMFSFFIIMKCKILIFYSHDLMSLLFIFMSLMIFMQILFLTKSKIMLIIMICIYKLFISLNYFEMFIFFEMSVFPMFLYVFNTGNYYGRIKASFYMFFYTILMSFPFLIFLVDFNLNLNFYFFFSNDNEVSKYSFILLLMVMLVKLPIFMFHMWLPKAHVESSVIGSMILASIMLKISSYLIFRMYKLLTESKIFSLFYWFSLWGCILMSIICMNMYDLKMLIAYSSVIHMSLLMVSLIYFSKLFIYCILVISISHAFISSNMFFMLDNIYKYSKSKNLIINKGMFFNNSMFMYMYFIVLISNFGVPPFMSFFSEIFNILIIINGDSFSIPFILVLAYFMSIYNTHFFFNMNFGMMKNFLIMLNLKKLIIILFHIFMSLIFLFFIFTI